MANKTLVIRADANSGISAGHVRRCLAIAREWRNRGGKCLFVCADGGAVPFVEADGFECVVLGTDWKNLREEISIMADVLSGHDDPLLLIDTYQVTPAYIKELVPFAAIGYIGIKRFPTDGLRFLINYSVAADRMAYEHADEGCDLLIGPAFAPLRSEFRFRAVMDFDRPVRRILLTTGNTDALGMVPSLIGSIVPKLEHVGVLLEVVVGPLFSNRESIFGKWCGHPALKLFDGADDMPALMHSSDLAISACGTTLYELAACGVPTVGFSLAPEQDAEGETAALSELGVIEYAGRAYEDKESCVEIVCDAVMRLIEDVRYRADMARRFHALVDGRGCDRICDELERLEMRHVR